MLLTILKGFMKHIYTHSLILTLIIFLFNDLWSQDCYSTVESQLNKHSLCFIENNGQINSDEDIRYYYQTPNSMVCFTPSGIDYIFITPDENAQINQSYNKSYDYWLSKTTMKMLNANENPEIISAEPLEYFMNFYYPHCPEGILNVNLFKSISYKNIYDGIDLVFYHTGINNSLKYDLIVHPGSDPSKIQIAYQNADNISIESNKSITISNKYSKITEEKPYVYQVNKKGNNSHTKIECSFTLKNSILSFNIGDYDKSKTLIIDPNVNWSTYWGGLGSDHAERIVMDFENNFFVTGNTLSKNFPISEAAYQNKNNGLFDAYLSKFDSNGNPLWSTYYGGDQAEYCKGLATDRLGNVVISGWTWSMNFPTSEDCYQPNYGGNQNDGFIVKFDKQGERLWATYLGGNGDEHIYDVGATSWDEIVITGWTYSKNLITSNDAFQKNKSGVEDAFIFMFDDKGRFEWGTFFGSDSSDIARGLDIDKNDNIIIGGYSRSLKIHTTSESEQESNKGKDDIFLAKFRRDGEFVMSVLIGGSENDLCYDIAVDNNSDISFCGSSVSMDFPTSKFALQEEMSGNYDAIIGKVSAFGKLQWSTYYGGNKEETSYGMTADRDNNILVVGRTFSEDFPVSEYPVQHDLSGKSDAFAVKFYPDGRDIFWSTYFGGNSQEWGYGVTTDTRTTVYICGDSDSEDLPIIGNSAQKDLSSFLDGFIAKFCATNPKPNIQPNGYIILCGNETVELDAGSGFEKYKWSTGDTTRKITVKFSGDYWVVVTDDKLCSGISDVVSVYVAPLPKPKITGKLNICQGDSTSLDAGNYAEYRWSTGETSRKISVRRKGKFYVNVVDTNGCKGSDTVNVDILPSPEPKIIGPESVCSESKGIIYITSEAENHGYRWIVTGGTIITGQNTNKVTINWGQAGNGIIQVEESDKETSCKTIAWLDIHISEGLEPEIKSSSGKFSLCEGDSITLNAGDGYFKYEWSTSDTTQIISVKNAGRFIIRVEDQGGCEGFDTIQVVVYPNPSPVISGDIKVCESEMNVEYSVDSNDAHSYQWNISGGEIISGAETNRILVNWLSPTQGFVEITVTNDSTNCSGNTRTNVLVVANPTPSISIDPSTEICEGDSVILNAGEGYTKYLWSTGETTKEISVNTEGEYHVTVEDDAGCTGVDAVIIIVHPNPEKPIITEIGNDIVSTDADQYQWYKDGEIIAGATSKAYTPTVSGLYTIMVFNEFGCSSVSDPIDIWRGIAYANISLPDTIYGTTGELISIPITITQSGNLDRVQANKFIAYINFNRTVLLPAEPYTIEFQGQDRRTISITGTRQGDTGLLSELKFYAALGNEACSIISIDSLIWENADVQVSIENCVFCLNNLCEQNGTRLIMPTGEFMLGQNSPNPFSKSTTIEYELIENGYITLDVFDSIGRKISTLVNGNQEVGKYSVVFYAEDLPDGIYFYILKSYNKVVSKNMFHLK